MPRRLLVLAVLPLVVYFAGYGWARASHRLVRYSGGFIARPNVISGIGWTTEQLVFAPAIWLEKTVRRPFNRL